MGDTTGIAWTHSTLNPIIGCQRVSPGCERCYAEVQDSRKRWGGITHWGPKAPRHRTSQSTWNNALKWNRTAAALKKRHFVFCASLSDVFEDHPAWADARPDLFALIRATPALTWQLLTKRPENIRRLWPTGIPAGYTTNGPVRQLVDCPPPSSSAWPNIWLGTTVEDQRRAEERLPVLVGIDAAVRWVSAEPLLGAVDLSRWLGPAGITWTIAGGESDEGSSERARPFDLEWARQLRSQCEAGGASFFMKQKGSNVVDCGRPVRCAGKGDDPSMFPPELRRQEFPMEALS